MGRGVWWGGTVYLSDTATRLPKKRNALIKMRRATHAAKVERCICFMMSAGSAVGSRLPSQNSTGCACSLASVTGYEYWWWILCTAA